MIFNYFKNYDDSFQLVNGQLEKVTTENGGYWVAASPDIVPIDRLSQFFWGNHYSSRLYYPREYEGVFLEIFAVDEISKAEIKELYDKWIIAYKREAHND